MPIETFRKRFLLYILLAWVFPPLFGVPLLVFFEIYSFEQIALVIRGSGFAVFALATLLFILWYFNRFSRPWFAYIRQPNEVNSEQARSQLRRFSLHYWGLFIITMGVRPSYILLSADSILGLDSAPVDWLRLHLVLLVVFILIGLPFFLRITDLLGLLLGGLVLERPRLTIRTKIFLIGSLVPLLIGTLLMLYYWSRTGYFSTETLGVWLFLELLAVAGTLLFVSSIKQSLSLSIPSF